MTFLLADYIIGMGDGDVICEGTPLNIIIKENLAMIYGIDVKVVYDE